MRISHKIFAFLRRDFANTTSYKLSFFLDLSNMLIAVFTFYFTSKLIGSSAAQYLGIYNSDYFSFAIIGLAFSAYFWNQFSTFTSTIMTGQVNGTLEIMLATPTSLGLILLSSSVYSFIYTTILVFLYLISGILLGVTFSFANIPAALIIFLLTIITFSALGLISAAFSMAFKKGDPIVWFFGGIGTLLGGQVFPTTLLPLWLQKISEIIPITHALRSMRLVLLTGAPFSVVMDDVIALCIFSIILLPLSIYIFHIMIKKVKMDGSLIKY